MKHFSSFYEAQTAVMLISIFADCIQLAESEFTFIS